MQNKAIMTTKTLAYCSLLAALSVVLARLIIPMPDSTTRFSIEAVPMFLAGMLFGPLAGGLVGFAADAVGTLFSGYGFNPIFCVPPILYGVFGGVFRYYLGRKCSFIRLLLALLIPVVFGSILYQSFTLAYVYYYETFWEGLMLKLTTRSIQFAITIVLDVVVLELLVKTHLFHRMGLWPPKTKKKEDENNDN